MTPEEEARKVKCEALLQAIKGVWLAHKFNFQEALSTLMSICAQTNKRNGVPLNIAVACFIEHFQAEPVVVEKIKVPLKQEFDA